MEINHRVFNNASTGRPCLCVYAIFIFALAGLVPGVDAQSPDVGKGLDDKRLSSERRSRAGLAGDAGEFYRVEGRKIRLLRSLEKVAVHHTSGRGVAIGERLMARQKTRRPLAVAQALAKEKMLIMRTSGVSSLDELDETVRQIQQVSDVDQVTPVYINEESGLEVIGTDEFIVKLVPDATLADLDALNDSMGITLVRRMRGTTDQFVLSMTPFATEDLLAMCEIYFNDPFILWASPNFFSQVVLDASPGDFNYLPEQWHLEKIDAAGAWDVTTGSKEIVVAVIDDGIDVDHQDLLDNFPSSDLDRSDNGYANDTYGWDFKDNDNDPRPSHGEDNHGTWVAGVIAANKGDRTEGVLGCAFNCTLMALKVASGEKQYEASWTSDVQMAEAILYAAGFNEDGRGRWHGADIINISLTLVPKWEINDALEKAATEGRLGKGCPIFCASGNDYTGWIASSVSGFQSDTTYTFRWQYSKTSSGSLNKGTVWLDTVAFPGDDIEHFEAGEPSNWRTEGNSKWISVQDGVAGNHAMTGWTGQGSRAMRAGALGRNETCSLKVTRSVKEGSLKFWYWPAMESGEDFQFIIEQDNTEVYRETFSPEKKTQDFLPFLTFVTYPASHPDTIAVGASTNFDYLADYSRYGYGLDFVAPSGGGSESIYTTDRMDTNIVIGAEGDYASFGGTSAASPLAAAVGALMLSANPDLTAEQVRHMMQATCEQIGNQPYSSAEDNDPNTNPYYGHGRINANLAVTAAKDATGM